MPLDLSYTRGTCRRFVRDEEGATAIEYALIASLLVIVALAAFSAFGNAVSEKFSLIASSVTAAS